jgi:glycosyltransferase involved in cell wall biosynthesis
MSNPLISIVTGTYNRRNSLVRMVESVRREIPRGLSYEIIVVDGGSTDGSVQWCKEQHDIHTIEHGELRGAIKAFCEGAKSAIGDYVILANDDITFCPYSIIAATAHLERSPGCAAVAFADNRTSLVEGDGTQYRTEGIGATTSVGQNVMVTYAQVGMFRRELGDLAGWWGADDSIMSQARTYGGDSYLSARLWEMGYTVDAVPQSVIEDYIVRDNMRTVNAALGNQDSSFYYQRFPTVKLPASWKAYPIKDRLRILNLPIYEYSYPGRVNREAGLTEALTEYGLAFEVDYLNEPYNLIELVNAWQPDLLITQIQGMNAKLTPYVLACMRNAAPNMIVVNWNGDAHESGLISDKIVEMLRYVDLQTTINAKVLPIYAELGVRAAYWQIGYKDPVDLLPEVSEHEVLFMGNCYNKERENLVNSLRAIRTKNQRHLNVGIYGNCVNADGNTHYSFSAQRALYQKSTIVVGDTYPNTKAFVSNRLFQALSSGAFMLQQHSESLQEYTGLIPNVHYIEWSDLADLRDKVRYWIDNKRAPERDKIAAAGRDFVRDNFSYSAQVRKLFTDLLPSLQEASYATA